jgi:hypothetical protein
LILAVAVHCDAASVKKESETLITVRAIKYINKNGNLPFHPPAVPGNNLLHRLEPPLSKSLIVV